MKLSVVVPIYNELESIQPLYAAVVPVLESLPHEWELVLVDDGSNDCSYVVLQKLAARDNRVKVVRFKRNFGQTAAMNAGLHLATGDVIITMDADLQNDPLDIPALLDKLEEGYDLVHGWRKNRQDALLHRKIPSKIANWLIAKVTGFPVRDLGCTLKAMRREVAQDLQLYGEMHRFIPILAHWRGANCAEIVTRHHARKFGTSKYGISRTIRVVLDLITVKYMIQYLSSPMRLFGKIGLLSGFIGGLAATATVGMKLFGGVDMTGNPLLLLSVFATFVGLQFLVLGMLGELGVRTYYESQQKTPYTIRTMLNFTSDELDGEQQLLTVHAANRLQVAENLPLRRAS
ncbi:MAG: glycosyltransferase family 2 protein [Planctomycetota bacterium]|nr:glycosyltransferase family 2 protein [Planctomycetota bacterium]